MTRINSRKCLNKHSLNYYRSENNGTVGEKLVDLLYDVFPEVLEDIALVNAIKQDENTETVGREEVFQISESAS